MVEMRSSVNHMYGPCTQLLFKFLHPRRTSNSRKVWELKNKYSTGYCCNDPRCQSNMSLIRIGPFVDNEMVQTQISLSNTIINFFTHTGEIGKVT